MEDIIAQRLAKRFDDDGTIITHDIELDRLLIKYDSEEKALSLMRTMGMGIVRLKHQSLNGNSTYEWRVSNREEIQIIATAIRPFVEIMQDQVQAILDYCQLNRKQITERHKCIQRMKRNGIPQNTPEPEEQAISKPAFITDTDVEHHPLYKELLLKSKYQEEINASLIKTNADLNRANMELKKQNKELQIQVEDLKEQRAQLKMQIRTLEGKSFDLSTLPSQLLNPSSPNSEAP